MVKASAADLASRNPGEVYVVLFDEEQTVILHLPPTGQGQLLLDNNGSMFPLPLQSIKWNGDSVIAKVLAPGEEEPHVLSMTITDGVVTGTISHPTQGDEPITGARVEAHE